MLLGLWVLSTLLDALFLLRSHLKPGQFAFAPCKQLYIFRSQPQDTCFALKVSNEAREFQGLAGCLAGLGPQAAAPECLEKGVPCCSGECSRGWSWIPAEGLPCHLLDWKHAHVFSSLLPKFGTHCHSGARTSLDFPMVNLRMLALPETSPFTGDRGAALTIVLDSDGLCSANSVIRAGQAGDPCSLSFGSVGHRF